MNEALLTALGWTRRKLALALDEHGFDLTLYRPDAVGEVFAYRAESRATGETIGGRTVRELLGQARAADGVSQTKGGAA